VPERPIQEQKFPTRMTASISKTKICALNLVRETEPEYRLRPGYTRKAFAADQTCELRARGLLSSTPDTASSARTRTVQTPHPIHGPENARTGGGFPRLLLLSTWYSTDTTGIGRHAERPNPEPATRSLSDFPADQGLPTVPTAPHATDPSLLSAHPHHHGQRSPTCRRQRPCADRAQAPRHPGTQLTDRAAIAHPLVASEPSERRVDTGERAGWRKAWERHGIPSSGLGDSVRVRRLSCSTLRRAGQRLVCLW
jgi:hypothetical protein